MQSEAFVIRVPLVSGYRSAGHAVTSRRGVIVAVTGEGATGWGEFVEIPGYSPETVETAMAALTGTPVTHSNPMAIAARRAAELDLEAKTRGLPMTELLGGSPGPVLAGAVVARFGDLSETLHESAARLEEGYRKVKIKVGPGFDVQPLRELRRRHPEVALAADANGAYEPGTVPAEIDELDLLYLEQPYPPETGWPALAQLRTELSTPICLDESITGLPTLRSAITAGACDIVNVKPARLTGPRQAVEVHDLAQAAGLGLVAGGLLETGVGRAAAAAVARLPGFNHPADLSASGRYWERDLTIPAWVLRNGSLEVTDRPGIGVEVDENYLAEVTMSRHSLPH